LYNHECRGDDQSRRLAGQAVAHLSACCGRTPEVIARAPGRLEVLGGHTDYNDGFVLAIAIERATVIAAATRQDTLIRAWSDCDESEADFDSARLDEGPWGKWWDYLAGVTGELHAEGCVTGGADVAIVSDVPVGGGVASSAAIEVASAVALSSLAGCTIDPEALALLCQRAENDYVGMRCGILDQFTSVFARPGQMLWLDCRTLERRLVPMGRTNARFVICNTNKPRELVASAYNERRAECEQAAALLGISALRDADEQMLETNAALLGETLLRRARHIVTENTRVQAGAEAIEAGDVEALGTLLNASHVSVRDDYEVSCPELEAMRNAAMVAPGCHGARLVGAGFGGCISALVDADAVERFAEQVGRQYEAETRLPATIFATAAADGAGLMPIESEG
jgi:galactokinase